MASVVVGVIVGALLVSPVGAHFTENTRHLGSHAWTQFVKQRVYTKGQADARFERSGCTADMVAVGPTCIDRYEVSVWSSPMGGTQFGVTSDNYPCADHGQDCKGKIFARSVPGVKPSAFITWFQAQAALTNSGKRLPTNAEWQAAAQGTPDSAACNIDTGLVADTGANSSCVSDWGAFDMVGNLWEWVADWDEVAAGCQIWSATFGGDVTCMGRGEADANNHFPAPLNRGGSFLYGTLAGVFAVSAEDQPSVSGPPAGFRGAR